MTQTSRSGEQAADKNAIRPFHVFRPLCRVDAPAQFGEFRSKGFLVPIQSSGLRLRFLYATTLCRSEQMPRIPYGNEAQEVALRAQHGGSGVAVDGGSLPARAAPAPSSTRGIVKIHPLDLQKRLEFERTQKSSVRKHMRVRAPPSAFEEARQFSLNLAGRLAHRRCAVAGSRSALCLDSSAWYSERATA